MQNEGLNFQVKLFRTLVTLLLGVASFFSVSLHNDFKQLEATVLAHTVQGAQREIILGQQAAQLQTLQNQLNALLNEK